MHILTYTCVALRAKKPRFFTNIFGFLSFLGILGFLGFLGFNV